MPDVQKLLEKAEKFLQKQKFDSALETFEEIYRVQPANESVLLQLGDLSLKLNRTAESLRYQAQLADFYIKRNDSAKAIATCRKILKASPHDLATVTKLAGLLEKTQKNVEALEAYREAAELHRKAGQTSQAQECLERVVKLAPENVDAHVELAELASRSGNLKVGTPAFLKAAQLVRKAGQEDRWAELLERAHLLDPADEAASIGVAEINIKKGRAAEAISVLEPIHQSKPDVLNVVDLLAQAYLRSGNLEKAQLLCWKLYQARPESIGNLLKLMEGLVQAGATDKALRLANQLKDALFRQGKRSEFLSIIEKIYAADESNLPVLEMLTALYNELNREEGLHRSLARLFGLYVAAEQYQKAADTLDKIIDVDPYGESHRDRLLNLEGKIDKVLFENIASRIVPPAGGRGAASGAVQSGPPVAQKAESLEDLLVEGEMFLQYQLTAKLQATLETINSTYPGAEERNKRLRELYDAAGFQPKPAPAPPAPPARAGSADAVGEPARAPAPAPNFQSFDDLKKISDITANIYREATPQGVMQVAVNELGRALNCSRCWGALGSADRSPTLNVEYCSPATPATELAAVLKIYSILMRQAATKPDGWLIEDFSKFPTLAPVIAEVQKLGLKSLLAVPLMDKDTVAGIILIEQCDRQRPWTTGEHVMVKAIATQIVVAVNNTKLRRLVRSLAGTDEQTGLLPRSSYIECLLAEASRAKEQSQPLSVCLFEPENPPVLIKSLGDVGLQRYLQQVARALQSNLRANDIAVRYNPCAIAVVFPDTGLPQGGLAVEKLRRVMGQIKLDGKNSPNFCAAVCDVNLGANFDAVDGVTEIINRLETALEHSHKEGGKRVFLSKFEG